MFDKKLIVSGAIVRLRPYTERRLKQLIEINAEIETYINENPNARLTDPDVRKKKGEWYKRKAEILWETERTLTVEFFQSEDFEASLLKESEDFFLTSSAYL